MVETESLEQIERLLNGRYVACYTLRTGTGFTGYGKFFAFEPDSVWDARGAYEKIAAGPHPSAQEALDAVIARAVTLVASS